MSETCPVRKERHSGQEVRRVSEVNKVEVWRPRMKVSSATSFKKETEENKKIILGYIFCMVFNFFFKQNIHE